MRFRSVYYTNLTLVKYRCVKSFQYPGFLWSLFPHIRTKCKELQGISPYWIQMRENTDQKKIRMRTNSTAETSEMRDKKVLQASNKPKKVGMQAWNNSIIT